MTIKYTSAYLNELIGLKTPERDAKNGGNHLEIPPLYASIRKTAELLNKKPMNKDLEERLDRLLDRKVELEEVSK